MIRMLLADDNRVLVKALTDVIPWEAHGVEVVGIAYDGVGVLQRIDASIDVLVTDVRMPRMDGIELTRETTAKYPDLQVIFLSAYSEFTYAVEALKLNVKDYITKPVDNEKLLEAVKRAGARRQSQLKQKALLEESLPYMREHVIRHLLMGDAASAQISRRLLGWGDFTYFTCMVFELFHNEGNDDGLFEALWRLKLLAERSLHQEGNAVLHEGVLALMIVCEEEPGPERTKEWIVGAKQAIRELGEEALSVTVGLSRTATGPEAVRALHKQAQRALDMRFLFGRDGVFVCPSSADPPAPDAGKAQEALRRVTDLARIADASWLMQRLTALRGCLEGIENRETFILTACGILNDYMRNLLLNAQADAPAPMADCLRLYSRIAQGTRAEGIELVLRFIRQAQEGRLSQMKRENRKIISDIYRAIEKVGFDAEGGLERIAQEVYLSPSYVSMLFKQETGKSISKVLGQMRLDRACELLQNPELKIYEISEQVGYPNPYYFSVWFKKNTGLTPTEYRKPFEG